MDEIINKQADIMISKYNEAKLVTLPNPKTIKINSLKTYTITDLEKDFQNIENDYVLYIFSSNDFKLSHQEVKQLFQNLKQKNATYHISKINEEIFWSKKSKESILYVGSKEKNIKKRIKEHLGLNGSSRSTYSLYLKDWWPDNTSLVIKIWQLESVFGKNNKYEMMNIIEDLIWDEYRPMFGKRGATFNKKTNP